MRQWHYTLVFSPTEAFALGNKPAWAARCNSFAARTDSAAVFSRFLYRCRAIEWCSPHGLLLGGMDFCLAGVVISMVLIDFMPPRQDNPGLSGSS